MSTVTLYGANDDLLKIEVVRDDGTVYEEEVGLTPGGAHIELGDCGTIVAVKYAGTWSLKVIAEKPGTTWTHTPGDGEDGPSYSDRLVLTGYLTDLTVFRHRGASEFVRFDD